MEHATVIGGFGGQGILFAGQVLAQAALIEGRDVSWMPSYGPEMRGGTASCTVVIADHPIGSPIVDVADGVIALNPPSMARYEPLLAPDGLLVLNSSLIEAEPRRHDIEVLAVPCTELARAAGHDRLVSVVALGALLAPGGLLVLNSSLIEAEPGRDDVEVLALPCTKLARAAGHDRLVSVVALGGLLARRPMVRPESVREALVELVGRHHPELLDADLAAFAGGLARADTARAV